MIGEVAKVSSVKVSPSILSADFSKLEEEVSFLNNSSVDSVHIDVMDGRFVPNATFFYPEFVSFIRRYCKKDFDVHLMLDDPGPFVESFCQSGADIVSIHRENSGKNTEESSKKSRADLRKIFSQIRSLGKKSGIVYSPNSSMLEEDVLPWLDFVDQVVIMSVYPGFGGQAFLSNTYERVLTLKKLLNQQNCSHIDIVVDGGVSVHNAGQLVRNGCTVLVAGNSIFRHARGVERTLAIQELKNINNS